MLVDIGSVCMCIDETIQSQLQIPVIEKRKGQLANGSIVEYDIVGPIEVKFKTADALLMRWFYQEIMNYYWVTYLWTIWMY